MPVIRRLIRAARLGALPCLGAVRTGAGIVAAFPEGTSPEALRAVAGGDLRQVGRGVVARYPVGTEIAADPAEPGLLEGRNVLVAIRNGERAEAAAEWLRYHAGGFGADAALVFVRDPPGEGGIADALEDALAPDSPRVVVVSAGMPMGRAGAPDARDPALAPGAGGDRRPAADPWHAPLVEIALFELLRHRFFAQARAVALLDIGDLLLPDRDGNVFDRAVAAPGGAILLHGVETYPWRLRRGVPAPHSDHVAIRKGERRWLPSWAAAPAGLPGAAVWQPGRILGVPAGDTRPAAFRRAMGVVFPGAPVHALVRKGDLAEDPALVAHFARAFGRGAVRTPRRDRIPDRPERGPVTVVTAMKNEGPFILDWVAHHRAIGVDRFLVYTNDCADGTDRLLELLAVAGVTRRDNPYRRTGQVPQHAAFEAARTEAAVAEAAWLATLDVDEYINIRAGAGRIADLLDAVPDAHLVSMPWRLFGNADRHDFEDRSVTGSFTLAAPEYAPRPLQAWAFKTLYRNAGLFRRLGVHRPKGVATAFQDAIVWADGAGRPLAPHTWRGAWRMSTANWGYDLVSVNHYAVRSAESFLVKSERGRVNHVARAQDEAYWFRMNHNAAADLSIRRFDGAVHREKAALLAVPGVGEAHEAAVDWHRRRIAALRVEPDYARLFDAITSPRFERLSRMATRFGMNVFLRGPQVIPDEIAARDPSEPFYFTVDLAD